MPFRIISRAAATMPPTGEKGEISATAIAHHAGDIKFANRAAMRGDRRKYQAKAREMKTSRA